MFSSPSCPVDEARKQVVGGVLLHQVKPPRPVKLPLDRGANLERGVGGVDDLALRKLHVQHLRAGEGAPVGGLAAPLGEEGGAVEGDPPAVLFLCAAGHRRGEAAQKAVGLIKLFGHESAHPFSLK